MSIATVPERLAALREKMKEYGIDAYLVPTEDFHGSEYVGGYFKCRSYLSGFTGSAGTLVVTADSAGLWVDGRYFLQASMQLEGTGIDMFKMAVEGVPTVQEYLVDTLSEGQCLGFDGRTVTYDTAMALKKDLDAKGVSIRYDEDLVGMIWEDRPPMSAKPVELLAPEYTGKSSAEKLADVRKAMEEKGADLLILTSLDDIAWLLNIRGDDVAYNPVVLSYMVVTKDHFLFFVNESTLNDEVKEALKADGGVILPYSQIYVWVKHLAGGETVMLDGGRTNYTIAAGLPAGTKIIDEMSPTRLPKAIKNEVEMENLREAHLKDGVAMTRFMYWLKMRVKAAQEAGSDTLTDDDGNVLTEIGADEKLTALRAEQSHFRGLSFNTIAGFGPHGAIIHYGATEESNVPLKLNELFLVDSGAQFLEGTTDITRTFVLGEVDEERKMYFTRVLRGMLNLAAARFVHGVRGVNLDYLARAPLWEIGLDYNHGTGHGVGYFLNCHEGPNGFRWKVVPERQDSAVLEEGMLTSDEPGVYLEGRFGVRHENLLLCRKGEKTEYGQFMYFETVTFCPFDLDGVDVSGLDSRERQLLNDYQQTVYEKISPYLSEEEKVWLREATRAI